MLLILKGFIIGIGKVLPGVSGSVLAIRLGVYEEMIAALNNLLKKDNIIYLMKLCIGIILAIVLGSKVLIVLLDKYHLLLKYLFIILIACGIPNILKNTTSYISSIISFIFYILILNIPNLNLNVNYYMIGSLEAITTIIPGISGTAIFVSLGIYEELLNIFSNIYLFKLNILIPFGLGLLITALILVRFIDYCFTNFRNKTYGVILGLLIGSIVMMIIKG